MKCVGKGWDQGQLLVKMNRLSPREDMERHMQGSLGRVAASPGSISEHTWLLSGALVLALLLYSGWGSSRQRSVSPKESKGQSPVGATVVWAQL